MAGVKGRSGRKPKREDGIKRDEFIAVRLIPEKKELLKEIASSSSGGTITEVVEGLIDDAIKEYTGGASNAFKVKDD